MTITKVRTTVLKGTDPAGVDGTARTWHTILVRADTDEGLYGLGEDGHLPLTDRPGFGWELNEDVCRECLVEG